VHTDAPLAGHFADLSTLKPYEAPTSATVPSRAGRGAAAFAEADLTLEDSYYFPRCKHYSMEPHAALAAWDEEGGSRCGVDAEPVLGARRAGEDVPGPAEPHPHHRAAARWWLRRQTYAKLEPITSVLARLVRRPVRLAISAQDASAPCAAATPRAGAPGAPPDGRLLAAECIADFDVGALCRHRPRIIQKGTYTATGPYRIPNVVLHSQAVYTNTTPGGAFAASACPARLGGRVPPR